MKKSVWKRVDWARIRFALLSLVLSALATPVLQPKFHGNKDALQVLVTVFSILAGFLIAVMAIMADDRALRGRNWREDLSYLGEIRQQLLRHRAMFYVYLLILAISFVVSVNPTFTPPVGIWADYALIFLSILALLLSFRLPGLLMGRHISHLEETIRRRRKEQQEALLSGQAPAEKR